MPNTYKITIKNKTGVMQNYHFFSSPPAVSGGTFGIIWSNVLKAANDTPDGGVASLQIANNYYAVCGSFDGAPESGSSVTIGKTVPVTLGARVGGEVTMGSTVTLVVNHRTACDLKAPETPGKGKLGAFEIDTSYEKGNEFTVQDAKINHLLVGIATSKDSDIHSAMGTFSPYPNVKYQVQPQLVFYVSAGESFDVGALVKVEMMASTQAVDFAKRQTMLRDSKKGLAAMKGNKETTR
ncbi:hypothetical protein E4U42_001307 [Claviceps africana]|uniref:Uncharacterized protein n=1 Tax=Claviceps africana TaxID=83212 RepID=A0A8K0J993_9HYPO|nr:hypothetical protein E4U42_001307 [Claviceps africana]